MPNWVKNYIYITDEDGNTLPLDNIKDTLSLLSSDNAEHKEVFSFNKITKMPEELKKTCSPAMHDGNEEYNNSTKKQCDALKEKYGYDNWYDWAWDHWDTKWDCCYSQYCCDEKITFDTAWSAPVTVIKKFSSMIDSKYTVVTEYADEDYGSNYGIFKCCNGDLIIHHAYDYQDYKDDPEAKRILDYIQGPLSEDYFESVHDEITGEK